MKIRHLVCLWIFCGFMAASAAAQTTSAAQAHRAAAAPVPPPSEQEIADTQVQLLKLLRMSPTLTTVVAHDPSLLADQQYVQRNNPELAQFLAAHPDITQNPDFYLFSQLNPRDRRDRALERAVWPEFGESKPDRFDPRIFPFIGLAISWVGFLFVVVWLVRLFAENRRWGQAFKQQNDIHARLIDKFSTSQELAAYMETEAGKRFLEAAPLPIGGTMGSQMPNAIARVLTPLQIGIVLASLGAGLLALRHAGPDTYEPMLILGMIVLMPGIGFILSAAAMWVLAHRLGLLPEKSSGSRETL
jgi:hypothetical protein